ncbi:MAG: TonB-dependent receptor [Bacteroidales bacterium]|nr:TonB-dependent receptor [Bacteroidales bacterium]
MNKNRNTIYKILFFVLLFVGTYTSHCQTAILEGRITNEKGENMEYVSVRLIGTARPIGDVSNSKGYYSFEIPSNKEITVLVTFTGYEQQKFTLEAKTNERKELNCILKPQAQLLEGVTIKDEKIRKSTFTQISIEKIENMAGPQNGVESLIKTLPDVGSNNELSSQYSVRGGSFDENLVYINDVEVYRPFLVRSGQQEGLSIINPDMVERVMFSPGGFEAKYGDKMSSVLDITYRRPTKFSGKLSGSLLGGSAYIEGIVKENMTYSIGLRRHSNQYLLKSLDTDGNYSTAYTDLQSIITYKVNPKLDVSFVGIFSKNKYGLVPENQTTNFGNFFEAMELKIYFDGQEIDEYTTLMGAITLDYHPNDNMQWKWITSAYTTNESEVYDIQGQYWLYELNVGAVVGEVNKFDRGVGTYLEHARNYLNTHVINTEIKGTYFASLGNWNWGARYQHEYIYDKMKEWRMVDSADFTIPNPDYSIPGDSNNIPFAPELQNYVKSQNTISSHRISGYLQRNYDFHTEKSLISIILGIRGQYWSFNNEFFTTPRLSINYKPEWDKDMLFRISTGMYTQSPFYREYRYKNGDINEEIKSQKSYQIMGTFDYNFILWDKPFKLTSDIYYKYITNLIPYEIDNMRIRYMAENNAIGYSTGISLRINGEFVDGVESWASISLMQTQEDIEGDDYGWLSRPTDQRMMIKLFFQDYMPTLPWMKVSLNFIYGTGLPFTKPGQSDFSITHRLPPYFRVDITGGIQLNKIDKIKNKALLRHFDDVWLNLEVFNLFNYKNVVSYIWIADYDNRYYAVPNFLTMRQFNIKLTLTF